MSTRSPEWSIELLRGIAAFMVLATHYHELAGWHIPALKFLHVGVDLFFVISGYVFAPYFFGKKLRILPFFLRRVFRLYPLYFVAVLMYALLRPNGPNIAANMAKHLLFLHTFESREVAFSLNPAFWSLPPEVEFYLALPLLAIWTSHRAPRLILLLLTAFTLRLFLFKSDHSFDGGWVLGGLRYHLPGLLSEFLLGVLAWRLSTLWDSALKRVIIIILGLSLVDWLWQAYIAFQHLGGVGEKLFFMAWVNYNIGLLSACAFFLITTGLGRLGYLPPQIINKLATWVGELSYGIYLFHNAAPLILERFELKSGNYLFVIFCLIITLMLAATFHVFIESPCRRFGRTIAGRLESHPLA